MIQTNRYGPVRIRYVAFSGLKQNSNRSLNLNLAQTLVIHIFQSITRIITNNIPLESLKHVESNSAIISHSFSIQIESIFKLNQTYLLAYLIHIFCSVHPKNSNWLSLESSNHIEHHRIKKFQSWYVLTLCAFKSIQITNLIIIWILEFILEWFQLL
jgi:hypothetical protein